MQNFDEKRQQRQEADRGFQIGGETFVVRSGVRPEVLAQYETIREGMAAAEVLTTLDDLVLQSIEDADGGHDRYRALRERDDDPLTLEDLTALTEWLVEQHAGRPTRRPSRSTNGRRRTGTTSTEGSSSPAVPAGQAT